MDMRHVEEMINERSFWDTAVMYVGQRKFISARMIYDYEMHNHEFESLLGYKIFNFSKTSRLVLGPTQPQPNEYQDSFMGVKWTGHKADHLPPSSTKVMKTWSYTSVYLHSIDKKHFNKDCVIFRKWTDLLLVEAKFWEEKMELDLPWSASIDWVEIVKILKVSLLKQMPCMNNRHVCVMALADQNIHKRCSLCGSTENNSPLSHQGQFFLFWQPPRTVGP